MSCLEAINDSPTTSSGPAGALNTPYILPSANPGLTRGVNDLVADNTEFAKLVHLSLKRHLAGDWGDLSEHDRDTNELALQEGDRLFSAYQKEGMPKIWIITEWDRSVTTVLFPEEY